MNKLMWKVLSVISFVISGVFTIMLMTSGTLGAVAFLLTAMMAVVLEMAKCGFFYEAIANKGLNIGIRWALGTTAVLLVFASIFASGSYIQNQTNKVKNLQLKKSAQFKSLEQAKTVQGDLYSVKKQEIEDLKSLQVRQEEKGNLAINNLPSNQKTKRLERSEVLRAEISRIQESIDSKSKELTEIASNLQAPIDTTNLKLSADAGYTSMFKTFADLINDNSEDAENPVKAESLEMFFFIGLAIIFEFVAVATAYLAQQKSPKSLTATSNQDNYNDSDNFETETDGRQRAKNIVSIKRDANVNMSLDTEPKMIFNGEPGLTQKNKVGMEIGNIKNKIGFTPPEPHNTLRNQLTQEIIHTASTQDTAREQKTPATLRTELTQLFGCIDKESMKKYLECAEESKKTKTNKNEIAGLRVLSQKAKLTESAGRNIFGCLKHLGIIEVRERSTYLEKTPAEYKKILELC
jgi:chaperonin cofactor prefoldin